MFHRKVALQVKKLGQGLPLEPHAIEKLLDFLGTQGSNSSVMLPLDVVGLNALSNALLSRPATVPGRGFLGKSVFGVVSPVRVTGAGTEPGVRWTRRKVIPYS